MADPVPPSEKSSLPRRILRALTAGDRGIAGLAIFLAAYYVVQPGIFQGKASGDGYFGFLYLRGIFYLHTIDLGPIDPFWGRIMGQEATGHVANACPVGPLPFWIPTYLLAQGLKLLAGLVVKLPAEALPGVSPFDYWMAGLGSFCAGLFGIATMFKLLARKLGVRAARVGVIAATLATPLCWYLVTQPLYQHACAFLMVTLLVERWDAWRGAMSLRRWAALGALAGGAMLMRLQEGAWLLLPGLDAIAGVVAALRARRWDDLKRALLGGAVMGAVALGVFLPQVFVWSYYYGFSVLSPGHWRAAQPKGHMRWTDPALVAMLFSTRGGLLPWTPIAYLVVPGLYAARKALGGLAWRFGLMLAFSLYVNASAWDHFGSWTYGARRFTDGTVIFAAGLGGLWAFVEARGRFARRALVTVGIAAILWNGLLMELVRTLRLKSSGAKAAPAAQWIAWANGPRWLGRIFDATGFPFCQPAGWIYALVYRVPPSTFEGVVGGYFLERDSRIHGSVSATSLSFAEPFQFVPEGIAGPPRPIPNRPKEKEREVPVAGRVRILIPLAAREPIRATLVGDFHGHEAQVVATWNGERLAARPGHETIALEVPEAIVHSRSRTNVLTLELPPGCALRRLDLQSLGTWWQ